jgi:hypothetical protein
MKFKYNLDGKSALHRIFFTGGIDKTDPTNTADISENSVMVFFRKSFSNLLFKTWFKVLVLSLFAAYLAVSVWGFLHIQEGLKRVHLQRDDSYLTDHFIKESKYFGEYANRIQV